MEHKQSPCPTCGGSGHISFFKGESRFLLSTEECPACCGFGYLQEENPDRSPAEENGESGRKG